MYKQKYLEYKQKYLVEKNQLYGGATAAQSRISTIEKDTRDAKYADKQKQISSGTGNELMGIIKSIDEKYP